MKAVIKREGNLRFFSRPCSDWPFAYEEHAAAIDAALAADPGQGLRGYGPLSLIIDQPPTDQIRGPWQIGRACTGLPRPPSPFRVQDYRGLQSISLLHLTAVAALPERYQELAAYAQQQGLRLRPYWRVSLGHASTPDNLLLPECWVSVFIDQ